MFASNRRTSLSQGPRPPPEWNRSVLSHGVKSIQGYFLSSMSQAVEMWYTIQSTFGELLTDNFFLLLDKAHAEQP